MFIVSFRKVGDVSWTLHGNEDNDPFTLTVPTDGEYEIMVEADDCPAFIYGLVEFTTDPPCDCATVDTANVKIVNIDAVTTVLRIPFIGALPTSPCGWRLIYKNLKKGTTTINTFTTLTNPLERVIDRYCDYTYTLEVNCCAEKFNYCAQGQVEAEDEVPQCVKIVLRDEGSISHIPPCPGGTCSFVIFFKESVPSTFLTRWKFRQLTNPLNPAPPDVGAVTLTASLSGDPVYPWRVNIIVSPTPGHPFQYIIQVEDTNCGGPDILWK